MHPAFIGLVLSVGGLRGLPRKPRGPLPRPGQLCVSWALSLFPSSRAAGTIFSSPGLTFPSPAAEKSSVSLCPLCHTLHHKLPGPADLLRSLLIQKEKAEKSNTHLRNLRKGSRIFFPMVFRENGIEGERQREGAVTGCLAHVP